MPAAPDWLRMQAWHHPHRLCLQHDSHAYSFAQVSSLVDALCTEIAAARPASDPRPAGILLDCPFLSALLVYAGMRLHWPVTVLNQRQPMAMLQRQVASLDISTLFVSDALQHTGWTGSTAALKVRQVAVPSRAAVLAAGRDRTYVRSGNLHALQGYIFTSGTTGEPKAIPIRYGNHYWSALASAYRFGYHHSDRWLHCLPLCHIGGLALLFRAVLFGFGLHLQTGFDTLAVKQLLETGRVTIASFVPTMLVRLLDAGLNLRAQPGKFRLALIGGAKLSPALRAACQARALPAVASYGLTETCSHIVSGCLRSGLSAGEGRPLMHARIDIRDDRGQSMPSGQPGDIWVRGPQVYRNTAGPDAWHATGDVGVLDQAGTLHVLDRRQDVYRIGGETVHASEVAAVLEQHTDVVQAWVQGTKDREWGWRLWALVVPRAGTTVTDESLRRHCRKALAHLKVPQRFLVVPSIPRTAAGKVDRIEVRKLYADG